MFHPENGGHQVRHILPTRALASSGAPVLFIIGRSRIKLNCVVRVSCRVFDGSLDIRRQGKRSGTAFEKGEDQDPEGPALIIPRGDLVYPLLTVYGVLERWSNGVMEETPYFIALRKQIPGENLKV